MAPENNCLKLNINASVVQGVTSFSIGMTLKNHTGCFVVGKVLRFEKVIFVFEAEAVEVHETLFWIMPRSDEKICVESDSLLTVQTINRGLAYQMKV